MIYLWQTLCHLLRRDSIFEYLLITESENSGIVMNHESKSLPNVIQGAWTISADIWLEII